jgi:hypothetical protein
MKRFFHHPFFIRLFNWEYWSFGAVYFWLIPAWLFFCFRARSFFFFSASNPSIENGGLIGESKKDIHRILPVSLYPRTIHFPAKPDTIMVLEEIKKAGLSFPLIGKPDIGGKGRGVRLLQDEHDIIHYCEKALLDFHIQEYIDYSNEVGIYYYRFPDTEKGNITGIVCKKFLTVKGNGKENLLELMKAGNRSIMYLRSLEAEHRDKLQEIIPEGEERIVSPYGNHARGSTFLDCSHLADEDLLETIENISKQIPGFYFGRFDIRFRSWEKLRKGKEFIVIEVNGAGAEPTHMYDPVHSIFFAWKEIIRHWNIMEKISRMNHEKGIPYLAFRQGIQVFRDEMKNSEKLVAMGE